MSLPDVFNLTEVREYPGFQGSDYLAQIKTFLTGQNFNIKKAKDDYLEGEKEGVHLNFKPSYTLGIEKTQRGVVITFHHFARIKKSGIGAAILSSGLTAVAGAGSAALHIHDAKELVKAFWSFIEGITTGGGKLISQKGFETDELKCPHCQKPIQSGWKACPTCGERLQQYCPHCRAEIKPDWKACPACGEKI